MKLQAIRLIPGTKETHDVQKDHTGKAIISSWGYQDLVNGGIPAIAIHASLNRLVIIDVDIPGDKHKYDGRPWWTAFCKQHNIPLTYTVQSASGGYHFYFALPQHVHEDAFHPPKELALGVDVKYHGYVGAPPTNGYRLVYPQLQAGQQWEDGHKAIAILPPALMEEFERKKKEKTNKTYENTGDLTSIRRTFSEQQVAELKYKLRWLQENATLTRDEWVNGIFSLKSGAHNNPELLDALLTMWTCNRSFSSGDLELARQYADSSDPNGRVGPGTIFGIIEEVFQREGFVVQGASINAQELLDKAGIIPDIDKKNRLKVTATEANAAAILGAMFKEDELFFDIRQDLYIHKGRPATNTDIVNSVIPTIQKPLAGYGFEKLTRRVLDDGLEVIMHQRQYDPHKNFLQSIKWDGVERIETCLIKYLGVEDNEYNRRLGVNLWTALAARGLQPGCKFDNVFVFEGYEGLKKSTFVEFLGGEYTYTPTRKDAFTNLDCLRQMHQSVVTELPELLGLLEVDDETAKGFVSVKFDHIRGLFAKKAMKRLRGFILMGTTNNTQYLTKGMGNRRWWPIRVPRRPEGIDMAGLNAVREQLYAEGVQQFRNGHEYWFMPSELLDPIIAVRQTESPYKAYLGEILGVSEGFTTLTVFSDLVKLGLINKRLTPAVAQGIEDGFRELGFIPQKQETRTVWVRSEEEKMKPYQHLKDLV